MQTQQLSVILNIVLFVALAAVIGFGVSKGNFDGVDKQTLQKKYVKTERFFALEDKYNALKDKVYEKDNTIFDLKQQLKKAENKQAPTSDEGENKACVFGDLSQKTQDAYVPKERFTQLQKELAKTQERLEAKKQSDKTATQAEAKTAEKKPADEKRSEPADSKTLSFTCDNELPGDFFITKPCQKRLEAFVGNLDENYRYNVVGMVDKKDFKIIKVLRKTESKKLKEHGISDYQVKQFEQIAPLGLARARAKEAMQYLKASFGKDAAVFQTSYDLVLENKRGFVIKAVKE